MNFDNNSDVKELSKILQKKLLAIGELSLANELHEWDESFFTTPSELLGEIRIILEKIADLKPLDDETKKNVRECLLTINNAFAQ